MRRTFAWVFSLILLTSCSTPSLEEQSKEELSHYIWTMTLVAPAITAAMGPFDEKGIEAVSVSLPESDRQALLAISGQSFHPAKVYGKIHQSSMAAGSKDEMVELARMLEGPEWQKFAENILKLYSDEGNERVAQVMRELDQEEYELDMDKAIIAETLSRDSYNYQVVDILFTKMSGGSPGERFLYQSSLLVTTYLAVEDFSQEELERLKKIRGNKVYQKYKHVFESVVSAQYDDFFRRLEAFSRGDAG